MLNGCSILAGDLNAFSITLIVIGLVVCIIPFLGCCGAITENRCMLLSVSVNIVITEHRKKSLPCIAYLLFIQL